MRVSGLTILKLINKLLRSELDWEFIFRYRVVAHLIRFN